VIHPRWLIFPVLAVCQEQPVTVSSGPDGAAVITHANGTRTAAPKEPGQIGIREAQVATGGRTVGWLAEFKVEGVSYPGALIIWRSGKPLRRFPSAQSFYSWTLYAEDKQVAFHVGPLHGEPKSHCELHEIESGKLLAVWEGSLESETRPSWTKGLNH
jgi:hypothetical protein